MTTLKLDEEPWSAAVNSDASNVRHLEAVIYMCFNGKVIYRCAPFEHLVPNVYFSQLMSLNEYKFNSYGTIFGIFKN